MIVIENNKLILDIIKFTLSFIVTICVMYITYQQWLINKRNEFFSINKIIKEEWFIPFKELMQKIPNIIGKTNVSTDKKNEIIRHIKEIKKLNNNIAVIFTRSEYEILMETFDKLISLTEKFDEKTKGYIDFFKNSFKYTHYLLLIRYILLRTEQPLYRPTITIYTIISKLFFNFLIFFTPYFIEKRLRRLYYSFLVWIKIIIPAINIIGSILKDSRNNTKAR